MRSGWSAGLGRTRRRLGIEHLQARWGNTPTLIKTSEIAPRSHFFRGAGNSAFRAAPDNPLYRSPNRPPVPSNPSRLQEGLITRSDGVLIGSPLILPLAALEPILAALFEPAIRLVDRNPAIEEI